MHYYIDGYNMLFRIMHAAKDDLQNKRDAIIKDINKKSALLKLNVSIVFDSTFQIGDRSRGHFDAIEILFTAQGETADEFIIEELKQIAQPHYETVVTSDKKLAQQARNLSAHTESIDDFLFRLNKSFKKKERQSQQKTPPLLRLSPSGTTQTQKPVLNTPQITILKDAPLDAYNEHYERLFEAELKELILKDVQRKTEAAQEAASRKRPPRKPRQAHDPFKIPLPPEPDSANEMERWLKLFENQLKNPPS